MEASCHELTRLSSLLRQHHSRKRKRLDPNPEESSGPEKKRLDHDMEHSGPEKKRIDQNLEDLEPVEWKRKSSIGDEEDFREEGDSALSAREKTARINVSETESTHSFLSLLVKSLYPTKSRQRREVNLSFIFHHIFHERLPNAHSLRSHVHCSKSLLPISLNILFILMKRRCKF